MNIVVYVVMFSALPILLFCFSVIPARRAVVMTTVAFWLFLPQASFQIPGLPDYSKVSLLNVGLVLATLIFAPQRILRLKARWYDLPIFVWCLVPLASSFANGMGAYDGVSGVVIKLFLWGFPYLIGRAYFGDQAGLKDLAMGIILGGIIYIPLCLYEIRMSPTLHALVYGYGQSDFSMTRRFGGYRPLVFLATGLEVGMFMAAATVAAFGVWITGASRHIRHVPMGLIFVVLMVVTILCKSSGAILLMIAGLAALWLSKRTGWRLPLWLMVVVAPLFLILRTGKLLDTDIIARPVAQYLGADRAQSFTYRVDMENAMMVKALQRPLLGWAWSGRAFIWNDELDIPVSVTDSLWIIAVGQHGFVGLIAITLVQVLPCVVWLVRYARRPWANPVNGASGTLAVVLTMYAIDNLLNAMHSPMYYMMAGGLISASATLGAEGYRDLLARGRALKDKQQFGEAAAAWRKAIDLLAAAGDDPQKLLLMADLHNDMAWLMCSDPAQPTYDPASAARSASMAIQACPTHPAAWNTLGVAKLRSGDLAGAIQALRRSMELSGGDAFDQFPLSIACRGLGRQAEADQYRESAIQWTRANHPNHPELLRMWAEAVGAER